MEENVYSIIAFGDRHRANLEIMLVNRLVKNQLFLHHGFELDIPFDILVKRLKEKGNSSFSDAVKGKKFPNESSLKIQPACFQIDQATGKQTPYEIHVQWDALFCIWLKRLHAKKPGKINIKGWALTVVQEIQGQTRRNGKLQEILYRKMIESIVFADKTSHEIAALLASAVEEHLGKDWHLFVATAFLTCIRLKDKLHENQCREIWNQMIAHALTCEPNIIKQLPPDHLLVQLEKLVSDKSIPIQLVADVIQLCGLFRLSSGVRDNPSGISFVFKQHLDQPTIQVQDSRRASMLFKYSF